MDILAGEVSLLKALYFSLNSRGFSLPLVLFGDHSLGVFTQIPMRFKVSQISSDLISKSNFESADKEGDRLASSTNG